MKRTAIVFAAGFLAACATEFTPVAPQPTGFDKDNPCNDVEPMQRAQAEYPRSALSSSQPGWVAVQYDIAADGAVANATVASSSPQGMFDEAALAAVKQWRYPPDEATTGCRLLLTFRPPDA